MKRKHVIASLLFSVCLALPNVTFSQQLFKGITEPYLASTVSATVAGRIAVIKHKEGAFVKKGDVILELEKDEEDLEVALRKLIAESKVEVRNAEYQAALLKHDYDATKQLFDSTHSVSEEELWKKDLEYKRASAEFERLTMMEKKEDLEYSIARARLRQRIITAPFDGVVVKVFMKLGESCNAQEPLVRLVDVSKCRFITHVKTSASHNISVGMKIPLSLEGGPQATSRQGTVEFISPVADPSSGLREIRVVFYNADGMLQPGVMGSMSIGSRQNE